MVDAEACPFLTRWIKPQPSNVALINPLSNHQLGLPFRPLQAFIPSRPSPTLPNRFDQRPVNRTTFTELGQATEKALTHSGARERELAGRTSRNVRSRKVADWAFRRHRCTSHPSVRRRVLRRRDPFLPHATCSNSRCSRSHWDVSVRLALRLVLGNGADWRRQQLRLSDRLLALPQLHTLTRMVEVKEDQRRDRLPDEEAS